MRLIKSLVLPLVMVGVLGVFVGVLLETRRVTPLDISDKVPARLIFGPTVEEVSEILSPGRLEQTLEPDPNPPWRSPAPVGGEDVAHADRGVP